jgi:hemolysin activation/secretion protein
VGGARGLVMTPYGFYDWARVSNEDTGGYTAKISSYGGGVRVDTPWRVRLDGYYAKPRKPPTPGAKVPGGEVQFLMTTVFSFH